jgi:hypothetical protein
LNQEFFPHYPATAICLYDRQLFNPTLHEMVNCTHPLLIDGSGLREGGYLN